MAIDRALRVMTRAGLAPLSRSLAAVPVRQNAGAKARRVRAPGTGSIIIGRMSLRGGGSAEVAESSAHGGCEDAAAMPGVTTPAAAGPGAVTVWVPGFSSTRSY